jgi:hypothetical protein
MFRLIEPKTLTYNFTRVFDPAATQAEFFKSTTLPLVQNLLQGENGLIFAYGVTNSGKTYTIQGGQGPGQGGILPRALNVIFTGLEGLHSDAPVGFVFFPLSQAIDLTTLKIRPIRLASAQLDTALSRNDFTPVPITNTNRDINTSVLEHILPELFDSTCFDDMSE